MHVFRAIDPQTGALLAEVPTHNPRDVNDVLLRSHQAWLLWREHTVEARGQRLLALAERLLQQREVFARAITREMGKPIVQSRAEVEKCATTARYYAEHLATFLAPEEVATEAKRSFVTFAPIGPVLAIMPWNFPLFQVMRFAGPALAAGNTVVLKHAPSVPLLAQAIEELMREAGFPQDVFLSVRVENERVHELITHAAIAAVSLCGSPGAGRAVASAAGSVLKKTVLELGGCDPYVVLDDANLTRTIDETIKSRMINGGQSCIGAKRCIVHRDLVPAFRAQLLARLQALVVGDPMQETTHIGPLAREDLRARLHEQVQRALAHGASCALGGNMPEGPGFFYPVTLLDNVTETNPAFSEELFGPVWTIVEARDNDEALRLANASDYGLGAAVFTTNEARGLHIATNVLEAGSCFVNSFVRSDPRLPFGGIKHSGYGRELGRYGLLEFVNIKTVWME